MRDIRKADKSDFVKVLEGCGLFQQDEIDGMSHMLKEHLKAGKGSNELWLVDEDDGGRVVGVAYCAPEEMADRVFNLYLLAVHPDFQRQGRGRALVSATEAACKERDARMLLIETSGVDEMKFVREMYSRFGYEQEGTVRDFYADGDDKITFRKRL